MMNYKQMKKYLYILCLILLPSWVFSQDILMEATVYQEGIAVKWLPLRPALWDSLNQQGYQLKRVTLNSEKKAVVGSEKVFPLLQVKDSLWWAERATMKNGVFEAIGKLLYDPKFKMGGKKLNPLEMRYNYLLYEAEYEPLIAEGLGLSLLDKSVEEGKTYQYSIFSGKTSDNVAIENKAGKWAKNLPYHKIDYQFATGQSLSQMSGVFDELKIDMVQLIGRAYEDSVVLRWAPNHAELWKRTNQSGYILKRQSQDGAIDTLGHIFPIPEEKLNESIAKDNYALIAAQMLYGKGSTTNVQGLLDKANIFENKYAFSIYAAEQSSLAANILGLRFVDYNVEKGKDYTYTVSSPAVEGFFPPSVLALKNEYIPLPAPIGLRTESAEKSVKVIWDKYPNKERYSSYLLEYSNDGGRTYQNFSDRPLVFLESDSVDMPAYEVTDSVDVNYKVVHYRLRGYNSFGELSKPIRASGMGKDFTPPSKPFIHYGDVAEDLKTMEIRWQKVADEFSDFDHYDIELSPNGRNNFRVIDKKTLMDTSYVHQVSDSVKEQTAYYFRLVAYDSAGNKNTSSPKYVHYPDLIAPKAPTGLKGEITEEGHVKVTWEQNKEKDLAGYWVYFANRKNQEYSPVTPKMLTSNIFLDTIPVVSLSEKIFYVVEAEDINDNRGFPSEVLELKRPDKVPPVAPVLKMPKPKGKTEGLEITWAYSPSTDVVGYELYKRKTGGKEEWELLQYFNSPAVNSYLDTAFVFDVTYEYKLRAMDDANLYSEFNTPVRGGIAFQSEWLNKPEMKATLDGKTVNIVWKFFPEVMPPKSKGYTFRIYKSKGAGQLQTFKKLNAQTTSFTDKELVSGALINYAVSVVYDTGHESPKTPIQSILYE